MHISDQLSAAGLAVFPCRLDKSPAVPKGADWRTPNPNYDWPTPIVGVPVPARVVIIDLDTYKGVTRESVDSILGCRLPWDAALIQTTLQGGQHYAFRMTWPVRHGSSLFKLRGFDTRVGGKGYIATGAPYYAPHGMGVFRLAAPDSLPALPEAARELLEHLPPAPIEPGRLPPDAGTVTDALRHIDPSCTRTAWVKVGLALRVWAGDDDAAGMALFAAWSSGDLAGTDAPHNYVPEHIPEQWGTFKAHGDTTIGSLFYEAVQAGWVPPSRLDTAAAFGPGGVAGEAFNALIEDLQAHGSDPRHTERLITAVQGNPLQVATLLALLTRELKDAGLLTKPVRQQLDALAGDTSQPRARGEYGKNHTENATLYLQRHYPGGGFARSDQVWYTYTGQAWALLDDDDVRHAVAADMADSLPQHSNIMGTYNVLCTLCHVSGRRINEVPSHLILFQNGVLDLYSGAMLPHSAGYFTTNLLPYEYAPGFLAPRWVTFLNELFEDDAECVGLLQEWFGYMLSNSYRHHKMLLLLGPGRSGKGTIGRILEQIVGPQNFTGASLHAFGKDAFMDALRTKSVAFSGDTERRVGRYVVDVVIERLKKISGNDAVTFERKWKTTLSQTLPTRITIAGNHVPNLFDDSGALAGRLLVLPINVSYMDRENLNLYDELITELPGIAAWALEGLRRLNLQGYFTRPAAGESERQHIAETYSPLKLFIDSACTLGTEDVTFCADLYAAYRAWAVIQQEGAILARRTFVSAFKDATRGKGCRYGPQRIGDEVQRGFLGVRVTEPATASAFRPQEVK